MMMTSKAVRKLYFSALTLLEAFDYVQPYDQGELYDDEADALFKLRCAVEEFQGEELNHGNNDPD